MSTRSELVLAIKILDEATAPLRAIVEGASDSLSDVTDAGAQAGEGLDTALASAREAAEELQQQLGGVAKEQEKQREETEKQTEETEKSSRSAKRAANHWDELKARITALRGAMRQAREGTLSLNKAFEVARKFGEKDFEAAANLQHAAQPIKEASGVILGALKGTVAVAGGFDAQLNAAGAAARATTKQLSALRSAAFDLGGATTKGAGGAAQALAALGGAGFGVQEQIDSLAAALGLAEVAGLGAADAAGAFARVSRGFNVGAGESGWLGDVLASASNSQAALDALGASGAAARLGGFGVQDAASLFEGLQAAGLGKEAGAGMQQLFEALSKKQTQALLEGAGIELVDGDGKRRSISELLADVGEKMQGLDPARQAAALDQAFGGGSKVASAAIAQLDAIRKRERELSDPSALEAAAERKRETMKGYAQAAEGLKASFDDLKSSVGLALLPALTASAEGLSSIMQGVASLVREHPTLTKVVVGSAAAFGGLLASLGLTIQAFSMVASASGIAKVVGVITKLGGATKVTAVASAALAKGLAGVKAVAAVVFSATGAAVAALAGLGVAIAFVVKNWGHYSEVWKGYLDGMVGYVQTMVVQIMDSFAPLAFLWEKVTGMDFAATRESIKNSALSNLAAGMAAADKDAADGGGLARWGRFFGGAPAPLPSKRAAPRTESSGARDTAAPGRLNVSVDVTDRRPKVRVTGEGLDIAPIKIHERAGPIGIGAS